MNELIKLVTLESLKGKRTQITIVVGIVINALVYLGKITQDQANTINSFLILIAGYFFAEKVSK